LVCEEAWEKIDFTGKKSIAVEKRRMRTKTIHQSVTFKANPHEVYEMLMDSRKHAQFTGVKAV
jgi:hypothetical protein